MFDKIKNFFKEEERFPCIIWDGKTMKYLDLTQKEIDKMQTSPQNEGWIITKKEDVLEEKKA